MSDPRCRPSAHGRQSMAWKERHDHLDNGCVVILVSRLDDNPVRRHFGRPLISSDDEKAARGVIPLLRLE
jgi:hypothetical protein